jgi:glutathione S-transferase
MHVDTAILSLENPVFRTYVLAAGIMILKLMLQPWMTVVYGVGHCYLDKLTF